MKKCYYEILQVDKKATPAEIKTNYRKLALKYHPDKNSQDNAKERFVEINEAYNVLSDPNERTWYDNNREKMLFNKDEMTKQDIEQYSFGFNIWNYFTTSCFKGYEDSEGGFYAVYRDVFQKIKAEEAKAYHSREDLQEDQKKYEGFGDSSTSQDRVLKFYEEWENFTTYKTFIWIEEWDTRDANSRWVRREMEKENKKQRQGEKKTYIKTIKDLLSYVRKRDPRFMEYLRVLKEEQEKKERERVEREKQKKKEKEEMKVVKQKLEEERFREIQQYYKKQNEQSAFQNKTQNKTHFEEQIQTSQFYCQICEKQFKSENQLRNHQKSKQHKQMVKDIQKEVLLKQDLLRAQQEEEVKEQVKKEEVKQDQAKKKKKKKKKNQEKKQDSQPQQKQQVKIQQKVIEPKKQVKKQQPKKDNNSSSDDDDHFMNTLLNNRVKKNQTKNVIPEVSQPVKNDKKKKQSKAVIQSQDQSGEESKEQKLGKAKLKKQKKAEQKSKGNDLKCNVCNQVYPSKTKLFEHINKSGHASAK